LPHIGGANIEANTGRLLDLRTAEHEELISGKHRFGAQDVLYSKIRPYLRKVALPSFAGLCSADIYPLRSKDGVLEREYLFYVLLSDAFTDYANRVSNRAGMPKINREQLFSFELDLPTVDEQRRIVCRVRECMHRIDELCELRVQSRSIAASLLPAFLNEASKSTEGPSVPLGEVLEDSQNGRSIRADTERGDGAVLTLSAVRSLNLDLTARKVVSFDEAMAQKYGVRKGDVFVSRSNTRGLVGLSAIVMDEPPPRTIYPDLLIRLAPLRSKLHPRYLAFALRFPDVRNQIQERATGSSQSMVKISGERLRKVRVPIPPLDVQHILVKALDEAYETCSSLERSLDQPEVDHMRAAVLRKAFAGEL